jgi:hypothetical protein
MSVDNGLRLTVWWPWVLVALVVVLAALLAALLPLRAWRSRDRPPVPRLPFYLDEQAVIEISQYGQYGDVLTKEVVDTVGLTRRAMSPSPAST